MEKEIAEVLDKLRPALADEGGDLQLVELAEDGTAKLRLTGVCGTCTGTLWTHRLRIERAMKGKFPDLKVLVQV